MKDDIVDITNRLCHLSAELQVGATFNFWVGLFRAPNAHADSGRERRNEDVPLHGFVPCSPSLLRHRNSLRTHHLLPRAVPREHPATRSATRKMRGAGGWRRTGTEAQSHALLNK